MTDRRLDPTTFIRGYENKYPPSPMFTEAIYSWNGNDFFVEDEFATADGYTVEVSFVLPLDILTEEQVIEILRRNGCPVPGGGE